MKFIQFLEATDDFDGEVYTTEFESIYSFVWDKSVGLEFTPYAKRIFKEILQSPARFNRGNIHLINPKITEDLYNDFMALCAGYVGVSFYDKCIRSVD